MKKGYIMVNIDIKKPEDWPAYRERSRPYVAKNNGRYILATTDIEKREGGRPQALSHDRVPEHRDRPAGL